MGVTGQVIEIPADIIVELGNIGKWIQAVGLVVILWIVFQGITMFYNRRRRKLLEKISKDMDELKKKVDRLEKKGK